MDGAAPTPTRSDRREFPAVNPVNGGTMLVSLTMKRAEQAARRGQGAVLEMAYNVPQVLRAPTAIFEGIRWDEDEDRDRQDKVDSWLCYCGRPKHYYNPNETRPQPASPNEVFLVFVNRERVVYHWIWVDVDEDGSGLPVGWETRFQRKVL